ncbi:hypothetical protein [Bradyrhizobium sp. Cp5.3]|uniref:hypothetical protein n=1 Tax=Bradyrhizobium sp. Cp5.3 TaxID=443598 RepID=UPI0003F77F62|nr:hypothetical protein [Bradyrhizobium sp. Cp5.3]
MDEIARYLADLDRVLLKSPRHLKRFMRSRSLKPPSSDELVELTFHKAITASRSLPIEYRRKSKAWLIERGYEPLDDGEL